MQPKLILVLTCLVYILAPVESAYIGEYTAVIATKPPPIQVIVEHKPVTVVPVATIPSYSFFGKFSNLWNSICDAINTKVRAVGNFFRPPPHLVIVQASTTTTSTTTTTTTTTEKPTTTTTTTTQQPPVYVEIVGSPQRRVYEYPLRMPVLGGWN